MSMSNSFSTAITSSTVSRLSAPRSSMKLASEVSLSRSTPSSSTMMSLTFSSSCFMSMAMINPQGGKGSDSGLHHAPAVDDQHLTRNGARQVGGEKEHRGGDVGALAESAQRNRSLKRLLDVLGQVLGQLGGDVARRHGVDQHVARGQLLRHRLRKAEQAGLGGRVVGLPFVADQPHDAGDVDDAAPAALDHPARRELGEQERGLEVRIQHLVPVLLADPEQQVVLGDAGVVDEDVDGPDVRLDRRDEALAVARLGDVAGVAPGPAPHGGRGGLGPGAVTPAQGDLRPRPGQGGGDVLANAPGTAGHQGGLAGEVDVHAASMNFVTSSAVPRLTAFAPPTMRLSSPASTFPGPISTNHAPSPASLAAACMHSTQRTGAVSWSASRRRARVASFTASALAFAITGNAGSVNGARSSARRR